MTKITSISTKTGDAGTTGLGSGDRVLKTSPIIEAIGTIDELNSWLGVIAASLGVEHKVYQEHLYDIQSVLFHLGAELVGSPLTKLSKRSLTSLEKRASAIQDALKPGWHTSFLLPGGTKIAAYTDVARTVCRRAERVIVALNQSENVRPVVLQYLNRLSDYLYLLRCHLNHAAEYSEKEFSRNTPQ
ncbi:MAG: cob(I)yrinic acid a,c-diamide adenosyltransferase [Microgenomates group bacterium]